MNVTSPLWRVMLLAEKYGRQRLTLREISEQIGIAPKTIRNKRCAGEFLWITQNGRELSADVGDVAAWLEEQSQRARQTGGEAR